MRILDGLEALFYCGRVAWLDTYRKIYNSTSLLEAKHSKS